MRCSCNYIKYLFLLLLAAMFFYQNASGQSLRSLVNEGVESYEKEDYTTAEVKFRKGVEKEHESFESHFNLGDALFKQQQFDKAIESYKNAASLTQNKIKKSQAHYNIGNSLMLNKKLKESVEAYEEALKLNPNDMDAKFNLSYVLNLMKEDQNSQQQNQNQDQKQDNENKDQQQDQNKQDQKNDENNKDQKQNQQNQQQDQNKQQPQQQPKPNEISKEEAQRILEALKNNEADIQKEIRKKEAEPTKKEKDW